MKIRLTRKGDAFAISKPEKGAGLEEDEAEDAPQNTSAAAGMDQDMADIEPPAESKERSPDGENKRRRLSSSPPDDNNGNVEGPPSVKDVSVADAEASSVQETNTEAATEAKNANDVKDAKGAVPASSEPPKVDCSTDAVQAATAESKLPQSPATPMDISPVKSAPVARAAPAQSTVPVSSPAPLPPKVPPAAEPLNRELYRIPSYAAWFSWNKIHNLERRALSSFFDGKSASKTPKIYKEYRDFMINKYRENSQRRLTFTEVRKMLVGDVNTLQKLFDFLEHWGLINNQVSADARKQQPGVIAVEPGPASMRVYPEVRTAALQHGDVGGGSAAHSYPSLASHRDILGAAGAQRAQTRFICTVCKAVCSKERYQRQGQAAVVLCPNCLKGEKYGPGLSPADFTLVTTETKDDWSQQETLLLLEGITRYGDNWNRVADHVGTKSKGECVMHFIGLPFGDRMLGDIEIEDVPHANGDHNIKPVSTSLGAMKTNQQQSVKSNVGKVHLEEDVALGYNTGFSMQPKASASEDFISPLLDASNPLMGQVAFLASMVGPRVAAAAAQAAVTAIIEEEATSVIPSTSHSLPSDAAPFHPNASSAKEVSDTDLRPREEMNMLGGQNGNNAPVQEPQSLVESANLPNMALPSAVPARMAIATALGVAAANAKLLADQEEREIESLLADIIDTQFKKLQSKLEHFEELEMLLEKERIEVERARTQVYADRIRFAEFQFGSSRIPNGEVRQTDTLHSSRPATSPGAPRVLTGIASKLIPTRKI